MSDSPEMNSNPGVEPKSRSATKFTRSPLIAAVASLIAAGAGQAYNRQWNRAIWFALVSLLAAWIFIHYEFMGSFRGMLLGWLPLLIFRTYITVDAVLQARKRSASSAEDKPVHVISMVAVLTVIGGMVLESSPYLNPLTKFRAFRVPSSSMCPTICIGDRLVSDIRAFELNGPRRGDVIMFSREDVKGLLVKRVVAVEGDEVSDLAGRLRVNGSEVETAVSACGTKATVRGTEYQPPPDMKSFRLRPQEYFVIGDNTDNSFDSRYFGPIHKNEIKGRPIYLYWSATAGRIGCSIK